MSEYILIYVWAVLMVFMMSRIMPDREEILFSKTVTRYTPIAAALVFAPVVYMAGMRGWVADTVLYRANYLSVVPADLASLGDYMALHSKDRAFYFVTALIKIFITRNPDIYFMIIAALQAAALVFLFRRYSIDFGVSHYLFIASTDYFSWMFNGMRQFCAVCIALMAAPFILKKKYIPAILIIVAASFFHRSALLLIPVVFIVNGPAWNKKTMFFTALVLLCILFVGRFTSLLNEGLQYTQYRNVVSDYTKGGDNGTNPVRVLVYSMPAIIAFVCRDRVREAKDSVVNLCVNMSVISMGLYLISMVTSGVYIGRLPIYVSLYGYILIPWEIDNLFDEDLKKFALIGLVILYGLFYWYQMHMVWGRF